MPRDRSRSSFPRRPPRSTGCCTSSRSPVRPARKRSPPRQRPVRACCLPNPNTEAHAPLTGVPAPGSPRYSTTRSSTSKTSSYSTSGMGTAWGQAEAQRRPGPQGPCWGPAWEGQCRQGNMSQMASGQAQGTVRRGSSLPAGIQLPCSFKGAPSQNPAMLGGGGLRGWTPIPHPEQSGLGCPTPGVQDRARRQTGAAQHVSTLKTGGGEWGTQHSARSAWTLLYQRVALGRH